MVNPDILWAFPCSTNDIVNVCPSLNTLSTIPVLYSLSLVYCEIDEYMKP